MSSTYEVLCAATQGSASLVHTNVVHTNFKQHSDGVLCAAINGSASAAERACGAIRSW